MTRNIACRLFKEQINLINQLPEKDRPLVLYLAINNSFNQFENQNDNQIENQNENAYVSVSVSESLSDISKCVLELLSKNIVCKEFSNNYGGKRTGSGRKGEHKLSLSNTCVKQKERTSGDVKDNTLFEDFWKLYTPVKSSDGHFVSKGNKQCCMKKFDKLIEEGVKYETIISGLEKYLTYCRENGHCSCGAEVFLNQRRFENDYSQSECVDSKRQPNTRKPLGIVAIGNELVRMSKYDESDSIPF